MLRFGDRLRPCSALSMGLPFHKRYGCRRHCAELLYDFGAERGDEIIIPAPHLWPQAILYFRPDLNRCSWMLNATPLILIIKDPEAAITHAGIGAVHLMGKPADVDPVVPRHTIVYHRRRSRKRMANTKARSGAIGDMACFVVICGSPYHHTTREGGIIITNNEQIAATYSCTQPASTENFVSSASGFVQDG